jgi:hypothetical protein
MSASRLVYPQTRTSAGSHLMSAWGQKRTHAVQQTAIIRSFRRWWRAVPGANYCAFAGASGRTAATPSGLMLKAKKVKGSPPGFPH